MRYVGMVKPMNGLSWRQYLKLDNLDFCAVGAGKHDLDLIRAIREQYFFLFPDLPKKCPVEKRKYSAKNVTVIFTPETRKIAGVGEADRLLSPSLPNGIYRHTIRFYTESDPEGMMLYWHVELYDSMGEDRL